MRPSMRSLLALLLVATAGCTVGDLRSTFEPNSPGEHVSRDLPEDMVVDPFTLFKR